VQADFMLCPSASVSIDIVGAVLRALGRTAALVEPTFDNIALLLARRGVPLTPIPDTFPLELTAASLPALDVGAFMLVQPNNPTGTCLTSAQLAIVAGACREAGVILVLDNSFRFYNRQPFDDYAVLRDAGVSYMALEDTGKVWPTHDLKLSLLFCSRDLALLTRTIYNELFLSCSPFGLLVLEGFVRATESVGLRDVLWAVVDEKRCQLRAALAGTPLVATSEAADSTMPVEWLDCSGLGVTDLEVVAAAAAEGLRLLPGRNFFWASASRREHQSYIRVALMKPARRFARSVETLTRVVSTFGFA
jgi:bifunctional pyridoxal-dependent enzyme with beta-cystathionase and maltose regulon repressor activities